MLRLTVLQALIVGSIAQELCLDDGVPESQREYIQEPGWVKMRRGALTGT